MGNYYFLAPSLPKLELGEWPEITFEELMSRYQINLSAADFEKTHALRSFIDFLNVRARFLKQSHDPRGNYTEKDLDEAILSDSILPSYFFEFLKRFETTLERMQNFSFLLSRFFEEEIAQKEGFLKGYFIFERTWRLILVALRAKRAGRDIAKELMYEDPSDPLVAQILSQKEISSYEPPKEFVALKELYLSCGSDPWEQYRLFAQWRFQHVALLTDRPLFSIDWILVYMVQHMIVEDYHRLELEKGEEILRSIVEKRVG
jgi:hypothetical protein